MQNELTAYNIISRPRSLLLGLAILWVAIFHSDIVVGSEILKSFKAIGYGGVDIFLFLSGFGVAHSLKKILLACFGRTD